MVEEKKGGYKLFAIAFAVLFVIAGVIAAVALTRPTIEPDYSGYVTIDNYKELVNKTLTSEAKIKQLNETVNDLNTENKELNTEFHDEIADYKAYDKLVLWAEKVKLSDKLDNELATALNISKYDLKEYDFNIDLERNRYASYSYDDEDIIVAINGEIEWDNGDDYGELKVIVSGVVEDDGELDDEEITLV